MSEFLNSQDKKPDFCPIFVDLDGTLIRSDLSFDSVIFLLKKSPWLLPMIFLWALKGRPYLKRRVCERIQISAEGLPYNQELLGFLKEEKARGRKIILASASDYSLVQAVADYLQIFDLVMATADDFNLSGKNKLLKIKEIVGDGPFVYAGNSNVDWHVWNGGAQVVLVSGDQKLVSRAKKDFKIERLFEYKDRPFVILRCLRIYQWAKNLLIFLPLILGHQIFDLSAVLKGVVAFFAFSFCASAIYIVNDLFDLESDRIHYKKRYRPIASGEVQVMTALLLFAVCLSAGLFLSVSLGSHFLGFAALYVVMSLAYSLRIKQYVVLDIIFLSLLYTVRLLAGGAGTNIYVSDWLMTFSLFFFTSLACIKRYSELLRLKSVNKQTAHGRGYQTADIDVIFQTGLSSALLSILVLSLYISSKEIDGIYRYHERLWLLCPVMMFWLIRVWLLAARGKMREDPVIFALTDKTSYLICLLMFGLIFYAI